MIENVEIIDNRTLDTSQQQWDLTVDFTGLNNVEMCPRWGGIRYGLGLALEAQGRAMALEAGKACHDFFAAVRLVHLARQGQVGLVAPTTVRLFGSDRAEAVLAENNDLTDETEALNFCLDVLNSSGFYDDPRDRQRTMSNLEESCIAYFRDWPFDRWPVFVSSADESLVGIELPVDFTIRFVDSEHPLSLRYVGRMDGLHVHSYKVDGKEVTGPVVHENKTGARIDIAWETGQRMSHQAIGYAVQASLYAKQQVQRAMVHGLQIPLPRAQYGSGVRNFPINVTPTRIFDWLQWTHRQASDMLKVMDAPEHSETRRHSCNRYFRPCSFMTICAEDDEEERKEMIAELVLDRWNPLEDD